MLGKELTVTFDEMHGGYIPTDKKCNCRSFNINEIK